MHIVDECYNRLPSNIKTKPWEITEHGRKVLQTEDELNAYIAAYGEMHVIKCSAALQNFPFEDLGMYPFEVFDWGCGQGLATLTLLDMLRERNMLSQVKRIYLIEPSIKALERAVQWVRRNANPGINIVPLNKSIPLDDIEEMPEVSCETGISINLFSNILDIRELSLSWLAQKTSSLASINYMVCVGPKFTQNTNTRISDFCGYFNPSDYFSSISLFPYSYTTRTHHAFGCETKCFVHKRDIELNADYQECANESYYDPYDYASELLHQVAEDSVVEFYNRLRQSCCSSYDIFFRPMINCDMVDIVLISKSKGIILINVCNDISQLKDETKRIKAIKDNIFNLHLRTIKVDSVTIPNIYGCVKTALYFPKNTRQEIQEAKQIIINKEESAAEETQKAQDNKALFSYLEILTRETNLNNELERITARGFKFEYYEELVNLISSKWHSYKEGDLNFHLSNRQEEFVRSASPKLKVMGVAGCGKTQVVANRAVEQHLKTGERVLILMFNISLIQYIRMRINQVPADFSPNMFEVINYHQFFKSKANLYTNKNLQISDFDNADFFNDYSKNIQKYKSIIIDEVQDFKKEWIQLIVKYFLAEDGSISLFGDGEQNIYDREMEDETKMPSLAGCNFPGGPWPKMNERIATRILNPKIATLSSKFAAVFGEGAGLLNVQEGILFEDYHINYWNIGEEIAISKLVSNILWILENYHIGTKDTVVLAPSIGLLRDIEDLYVKNTNQRTMINFETASQYGQVCNQTMGKDNSPTCFNNALNDIRRAAKTHFTTDCDAIKMSTIHSFKGWEATTTILLLQPERQPNKSYGCYQIHERESSPALIYTALTRAKCNLFILNLGNTKYHKFFSQNIQ